MLRVDEILSNRRLRVAALAAAALAALAVIAAGELLSRPASRVIGAAPPDLQARDVSLPADGYTVRGWFVPGTPGVGAVLLLHGVRGDRMAMLQRARMLKQSGYSVLLVDLPAHGESGGGHITFGWREAAGVRSALDWLRHEVPMEKAGVIGVSLGAAALVYSGLACLRSGSVRGCHTAIPAALPAAAGNRYRSATCASPIKAATLTSTVPQNFRRNDALTDLWRSHCCATTPPGQPQHRPSINNVLSGMRQRPARAADLSAA
ncbi:hypothetical protein GCM10027277_00940 [Pseudoduganella ginsengisoli]|uniref:Alpha/beta fold hydrolase n=1 Tax=Pseudoduganella ginsengisoli TaxID=1462440 RepID=A0A6L6Q2H8_9BURK|nr:alpha/beta fold hydrolase [Pseudoduganella ginsengisoli]